MTKPLEEWQHHIRHTSIDQNKTSWCGVVLHSFDWAFVSIDHAVYSARHEDRLQPCPLCVAAICQTFGTPNAEKE